MEVARKGCEQELTEHLKSIDTTGSIKFTYDEENRLIYIDLYNKNFTSHHPLHQKLRVIKTLLDRCNNIVSQPEDR